MALKGSLDDFNIINILQMVKLEGKSGRLTLTDNNDVLKITFDNGAIIYAESLPSKDEARIKQSLLSNRLIDPVAWGEVKRLHDDRLKPYWELLAKKIPSAVLIELINRQTIDTVYEALRWKIGSYEFANLKTIRYNEKVMQPMDVDALLMEGCRLADEWPRLLKSLPPLTSFVVRNIIDEEEDASINIALNEGGAGGWESSLENEILNARGIELNNYDIATMGVIGSGKTILEILDAARQGKYQTLESVQRMLQQGIILVTKKKAEKAAAIKGGGSLFWLLSVLLLLLVIGGGAYWQWTYQPTVQRAQSHAYDTIKGLRAMSGIHKITDALSIYYSLNGIPPKGLATLADRGLLKRSDLIDPWNNPYRLQIEGERFALYSTGKDPFLKSDDVYLPWDGHAPSPESDTTP